VAKRAEEVIEKKLGFALFATLQGPREGDDFAREDCSSAVATAEELA